MLSLPSELFFHICSFLSSSNPDLAALARVSLQWSAVAQRLLYARVNINRPPGPLTTLATNSPLAAAVRSCAVSLNDHLSSDLLATALANMSHLHELDLFVDNPSILPTSPSYPLLHRFATSLPCSDHLVRFLQKSPTITQLYLDSPALSLSAPIPSSFLPNLSHFTGPPDLALLLVPHRPVQHIDLTSSNPKSQGLTPSLALSLSQSSAPVLALAATTSSTAHDENLVGVLRVLATCMGHLRHLRLVANTYADAFDTRVFDHTYFENITDALSSLPDLQSCEIWGFHWVSSKMDKRYSASTFNSTSTWHLPSFTINANNSIPSTNNNFLDDLYQDLIFPY